MKFSRLLLAVCALCVAAGNVQAGILSSHLTFDGVPDIMEDDSRANLFDPGGDGFSIFDVVWGFVSVSDFNPSGNPSPDEVAILFAAEIYGTAANGTFQLGPVRPASNGSANGAFTLGSLLGVGSPLLPVVGPGAPFGATTADAIAVVVSNTGVDPLAPELGSLAAFNAAFGYEATIGVDPASVLTGVVSGDFFHFFPVAVSTPPPVPGDLIASETAGFSIFDHPFSPSVIFLGVTATRLDTGAKTVHDVRLFEGSVFLNDDTTSPWSLTDNSNFSLNPTPEPTSLVIWGLLAFLGFAACRRRNRA